MKKNTTITAVVVETTMIIRIMIYIGIIQKSLYHVNIAADLPTPMTIDTTAETNSQHHHSTKRKEPRLLTQDSAVNSLKRRRRDSNSSLSLPSWSQMTRDSPCNQPSSSSSRLTIGQWMIAARR